MGALLGAVIVTLVASLIEVSIYEDVYYNPYLFHDTSNPFIWSVIMICVQPAIFEEVAFRGFLFNNLEKITAEKSAIYITGFLFGIIHLSFISLLWLVPIGLVFAMMRLKYNTLWYGIVGHFSYNLFITVIEFWF
jgi:membrane protease YdiL (CAAX protease family)